ncbi:HinT-interacting membrane complex lipoprotein P60 [Mycoplasma sp. CB776]
MKKIKYSLLTSVIAGIIPLSVVSCSPVEVESSEKIIQDEKLKKEVVKRFIETKYIETILTDKWFKNQNLDQEFKNKNSEFYALVKKAFNFYQKQELKKDSTFTVKFINDLNSNNFLTTEELKELYTEVGPNKLFTEKGFEILFNNNNSDLKNNILKMVLVFKFLTSSESKDIIESNKYKTNSAEKNTNYNQRLAYQNTNPETKDFFLKTLLLEKQPAQIWKYESTDSDDLATYNLLEIKDENSFNSLVDERFKNSKNTNKIQDFELLNVNDDIDLKQLLSYQGILYNQGSNPKGSFNYDVYTLKRETNIKSGFVDENSRIIYSKNDLAAAESWKGKKELPIKLKDSFDKTKTKYQLTKEDIEVVKAAEHSDVTYTVEKIMPFESDSIQKRATVIIKMVLTTNKDQQHPSARTYAVDVTWDSSTPSYSPNISDAGRVLSDYPSSVKAISSDLTKISASYVNKIVPLFDENKATTKDNVTTYKTYFSLDHTPWNTVEQKEILAFSLYLADKNTLYEEIKKFYEDAGYKIEYKDSILDPESNNKNTTKK